MVNKDEIEFCRERARHYRNVAELVSDPRAAEFYRLLARAFAAEAKEKKRRAMMECGGRNPSERHRLRPEAQTAAYSVN